MAGRFEIEDDTTPETTAEGRFTLEEPSFWEKTKDVVRGIVASKTEPPASLNPKILTRPDFESAPVAVAPSGPLSVASTILKPDTFRPDTILPGNIVSEYDTNVGDTTQNIIAPGLQGATNLANAPRLEKALPTYQQKDIVQAFDAAARSDVAPSQNRPLGEASALMQVAPLVASRPVDFPLGRTLARPGSQQSVMGIATPQSQAEMDKTKTEYVDKPAASVVAKASRLLSLAAFPVASVLDDISGTDEQKARIAQNIEELSGFIKDRQASPEVGGIGQLVRTGQEMVGSIAALGPAAIYEFPAQAFVDTTLDSMEQGVDQDTSIKRGLLSSASTVAMMGVPLAGKSIVQGLSRGVTFNPALGVSSRLADKELLKANGYDKQAEAINPLDPQAIGHDALMGIAFSIHQNMPGVSVNRKVATEKGDVTEKKPWVFGDTVSDFVPFGDVMKSSWDIRKVNDFFKDELKPIRESLKGRGWSRTEINDYILNKFGEAEATAKATVEKWRSENEPNAPLIEVKPEEGVIPDGKGNQEASTKETVNADEENANEKELLKTNEPVKAEAAAPVAASRAEEIAARIKTEREGITTEAPGKPEFKNEVHERPLVVGKPSESDHVAETGYIYRSVSPAEIESITQSGEALPNPSGKSKGGRENVKHWAQADGRLFYRPDQDVIRVKSENFNKNAPIKADNIEAWDKATNSFKPIAQEVPVEKKNEVDAVAPEKVTDASTEVVVAGQNKAEGAEVAADGVQQDISEAGDDGGNATAIPSLKREGDGYVTPDGRTLDKAEAKVWMGVNDEEGYDAWVAENDKPDLAVNTGGGAKRAKSELPAVQNEDVVDGSGVPVPVVPKRSAADIKQTANFAPIPKWSKPVAEIKEGDEARLTAAEAQELADEGDGFITRITNHKYFDSGVDSGNPDYGHGFNGVKKPIRGVTSFAMNDSDNLVSLKMGNEAPEEQAGMVHYKVRPADIGGEFVAIKRENGVVHLYSDRPVDTSKTEVILAGKELVDHYDALQKKAEGVTHEIDVEQDELITILAELGAITEEDLKTEVPPAEESNAGAEVAASTEGSTNAGSKPASEIGEGGNPQAVGEEAPDARKTPEQVLYELAESAHAHTAMNPRTTAKVWRDGMVSAADELQADISKLAHTDEQKAVVESQIAAFKRSYVEHSRPVLNAISRQVSIMVAGGSKFAQNHGKRNEKAQSAEQNANAAFTKWINKAKADAKNAVLAARTPEQVAADEKIITDAAYKKKQGRADAEKELVRRWMNLKVGDKIDIGGNQPAEITKKNRKSVETGSGAKWTFGELYSIDSKRVDELMQGIEQEKTTPATSGPSASDKYEAARKEVDAIYPTIIDLEKPEANHIVMNIQTMQGGQLGKKIAAPYDGTKEDALRVAKALKLYASEELNASMRDSAVFATDANYNPKYEFTQGAGVTEISEAAKPATKLVVPEIPVSSEAKEPWEMTRDEYVEPRFEDQKERGIAKGTVGKYARQHEQSVRKRLEEEHRALSEQAVIDGKEVPFKNKPFWALTAQQSADRSGDSLDSYIRNSHKEAVSQAVADGKPVPVEVLAEYPDLTPDEPVTVQVAEPPKGYTLPAEYTTETQRELMKSLRNGETVEVDTIQSAYKSLLANKESIIAELSKQTKDVLLKQMGGMDAHRYKNDKKEEVVKALYRDMITDFAYLDGDSSFSYSMGEKMSDVVQKRVNALTPAKLKAYADKVAERKEASKQRVMDTIKAIKDPETLEDFRTFIRAQSDSGLTLGEARKLLTPAQQEKYDDLAATESRSKRKDHKNAQKTEVRVAGQTTAAQIVEGEHSKLHYPIWSVQLADKVDGESYKTLLSTAKRMGGNYVNTMQGKMWKTVWGFQFKDLATAEAFLKLAGGDTSAAKETLEARRDAFVDDRSQTAVERLNEMADTLEERAQESLNRDRKANTAKRAGDAARAEGQARREIAMAETMRNIAKRIESGEAKFLDQIRTKAQIEMLDSFIKSGQDKAIREATKGDYLDYLKQQGRSLAKSDAGFAEYPSYTAFRSDLARLGRELEEIDGTKKLGAQLTKIANDVTTAYLKFAKANLHKISTFGKKNSSTGEVTGYATFGTRDAALAAISRSGYKGKATVVSFTRGEHLVVMGPEMAKEAGLWEGDNDKLINLPIDLGETLVAKNKTIGKRNRISVPWTFDAAHEKRTRLASMGIETAPEFRAALREYVDVKQPLKEADKIKELERAMVGRKNDGMDFFPTPAGVSQEMIETADIQDGMTVLEPSAGMGHIADQIREAGYEPDVVEMSNDRKELLEAKGYKVAGRDFMDVTGKYDRIIMNPPFSDRRDAQHVQHAFTLLNPGGRIVAIMGEGVFFGQDKKAVAFRDWLDDVGGTSEKLGTGTFLDPSLPVNTGVNARMVVIDVPGEYVPGAKAEVTEESAPNIPTFQEAKEGEIYQTKVSRDGEAVTMYAVPVGGQRGAGDLLFNTYEEAVKEQGAKAELDAKNAEYRVKAKEQEEAAKEKADSELSERNDLDGFGAELTPMHRAKAAEALNKAIQVEGQPTTIKAQVKKLVEAGELATTEQHDKVKPMTRTQFNRATQKEQDAHEKRVKEAGKKTVYYVGDFDLGKTAYDYAQYLIGKGPTVKEYLSLEKLSDISPHAVDTYDKVAADKESFYRMNRQYGKLSIPELEAELERMGGELSGLQKSGSFDKEFNGGGRRTAPSVAAEGARELGQLKMELGRYIKERQKSEEPAFDAKKERALTEEIRGMEKKLQALRDKYSKDGRSAMIPPAIRAEQMKSIEKLADVLGAKQEELAKMYSDFREAEAAFEAPKSGLPQTESAETATVPETVPAVDPKGFTIVEHSNGFNIERGNLKVKAESTENGKYQASWGSATSSPRLDKQGVIDWAENIINQSQHKVPFKNHRAFELGLNDGASEFATKNRLSPAPDARKSARQANMNAVNDEKAYIAGFELAQNQDYVDKWRENKNLSNIAFKRGDARPVGWEFRDGWAEEIEKPKPATVDLTAEGSGLPTSDEIQPVEQEEEIENPERDEIAQKYADALGHTGVSEHHLRFADAIINKDGKTLGYLSNGLNDTGKKVFSEVTGIKLPKQQGKTLDALREWGGLDATKENLYDKTRSAERAYSRALNGLDGIKNGDQVHAMIEDLFEKGFTHYHEVKTAAHKISAYLSSPDDLLHGHLLNPKKQPKVVQELAKAKSEMMAAYKAHDEYSPDAAAVLGEEVAENITNESRDFVIAAQKPGMTKDDLKTVSDVVQAFKDGKLEYQSTKAAHGATESQYGSVKYSDIPDTTKADESLAGIPEDAKLTVSKDKVTITVKGEPLTAEQRAENAEKTKEKLAEAATLEAQEKEWRENGFTPEELKQRELSNDTPESTALIRKELFNAKVGARKRAEALRDEAIELTNAKNRDMKHVFYFEGDRLKQGEEAGGDLLSVKWRNTPAAVKEGREAMKRLAGMDKDFAANPLFKAENTDDNGLMLVYRNGKYMMRLKPEAFNLSRPPGILALAETPSQNHSIRHGDIVQLSPGYLENRTDEVYLIPKGVEGDTFYQTPIFDPAAVVNSLSGLKNNLKEDLPKLVELGKRAFKEGKGKFDDFRTWMKKTLGGRWDSFKSEMARVWGQVKSLVGNRHGSVGPDIKADQRRRINEYLDKADEALAKGDEEGALKWLDRVDAMKASWKSAEEHPEVDRIYTSGTLGEYEIKESGLAIRTQAEAIEAKLTEDFGPLADYKTMNMQEQAEAAGTLMDADYPQAIRMAMGEIFPPDGVREATMYEAVKIRAIAENDVGTLRRLATESTVPSRLSEYGQAIKAADSRLLDDPVKVMQEVAEARAERAEKIGVSKSQTAEIERLKAELDAATAALEAKYSEHAVKHLKKEAEAKIDKLPKAERKAALDAEFDGLARQLAAKFGRISANPMLDPETIMIMLQMARNRIKAGVNTADGVINDVYAMAKDVIVGLRKRDIRVALSNYGKTKELNQDEVEKTLRELKRQWLLISKIEDVKKGTFPKLTGLKRDPKTDKLRAMEKELHQLMKATGLDNMHSPESRMKTALDAAKTRLRNEIADLDRQIKTKKRDPVQKTGVNYDKEAMGLKATRDAKKALLDSIDARPGVSEARRIAIAVDAIKRSIEAYTRRIETGEKPKVGVATPQTPEIIALKEQRDGLKATLKEIQDAAKPPKDPEAIRMQSYKTRLTNEIAKFEKLMEAGDFDKAGKKEPVQLDAEGKKLKAAHETAKENYQAAVSVSGTITPEEAAEIVRLSKITSEARDAIEQGGDRLAYGAARVDYENFIEDLKGANAPIKTLIKERVQEAKTTWAENKPKAVLDLTRDTLGAITDNSIALVASVDNSFLGRQGLKTLFTHPTAWAPGAKKSFVDFVQTLGGRNAHDAMMADIYSRPNYMNGEYQKAKIIAHTEEQYPTSIPERIPLLGRVFKASEVAFKGSALRMRTDLYDLLSSKAKDLGVDMADKEQAIALGKLINSLTARGQWGKTGEPPVVRLILWAPKMLKANIDVLTAHNFGAGLNSDFARKEAAQNLLKIVAITALLMAIANALIPDSAELDPRSSDFGKIKIGNTRFDFTGGAASLVTLAARLVTRTTKSAETGFVTPYGSGFGERNAFNTLIDFLANKVTPPVGVLISWLKGTNRNGDPFTWSDAAARATTPISVRNFIELKDDASAEKVAGALVDIIGLNANTYSDDGTRRGDIVERIRRGRELSADQQMIFDQMSQKQKRDIKKDAKGSVRIEKAQHLAIDKLAVIMESSGPEVKEELRPVMARKLTTTKNIPKEERPRYRELSRP